MNNKKMMNMYVKVYEKYRFNKSIRRNISKKISKVKFKKR